MKKVALIVAVLVAMAGLPLMAAPVSCRAYQGWELVAYWAPLTEGCYVGDKVFSNWDYTGPGDPSVMIQEPTENLHVVNVGALAEGVHHFEYVVSLYGIVPPDLLIRQITLGVNYAVGLGAQAYKTLSVGGQTLDILYSTGATDYSIPLGLTSLKVSVDVTVPNGVTVGTIVDGIHQGVPEPMTLSLIGAGLLAIGLLRRRKK